jgi:hypothetical protein
MDKVSFVLELHVDVVAAAARLVNFFMGITSQQFAARATLER